MQSQGTEGSFGNKSKLNVEFDLTLVFEYTNTTEYSNIREYSDSPNPRGCRIWIHLIQEATGLVCQPIL